MKNKLIIIPNNVEEITKLRNVDLSTFLLPLEHYSIGYNSFTIDEINNMSDNIYLYINRILTTKEIENLIVDLKQIQNIKGIFYEDFGVFYALKDKYKLYNYQQHFNTHYKVVNYLLELGNESVVIPQDLTYKEIEYIKENVYNPIILFLFGKTNIMYSRRTLKQNYEDNYGVNMNENIIKEEKTQIEFELSEDNNGTYIFDNHFYNGSDLLNIDDNNNLFYIISAYGLKFEELISVINNIKNNNYDLNSNINDFVNTGFLYKETYYIVRDGDKND